MGLFRFILLFSVIAIPAQSNANEWQLVEDSLGIKVFRKDIPSSNIDEIRAESIIQADTARLSAIMEDIENFSDWMFACIDSKIIEYNSNSNFKLYYVHETPWPYKDRDVVLDIIGTKGNLVNWFKVEMNSVESDYAPSNDLVRMESMQGSWVFKKVADNKTRVEFQLYVDPSGNVPFPFINSGNVKVVFETFKELKRKANRQAYFNEVKLQESKNLDKALIDSGFM
ncbi:MAG: hypothetical protein D6B28_08385 [Gammaproteobacteria bacterium]|nr:MAG: hypothetical protein D6B28_08385 [Gammaproteobacteria bacterium]